VNRRWVIASGNTGKIRELTALFEGSGCELIPQRTLGVAVAQETGTTFVENALIKARHASAATGLPAFGDDSGLCVDALDGAPGVHSARYAGVDASDADNVGKLLEALAGVPEPQRGASFHCVIVALRFAHDPAPLIAAGIWRGRIATAPQGEQGFGYDPVFMDLSTGRMAALLAPEHKNRVSHRGLAVARLGEQLREQGWVLPGAGH
jgi:XTP/dITP diphosphohydrolase